MIQQINHLNLEQEIYAESRGAYSDNDNNNNNNNNNKIDGDDNDNKNNDDNNNVKFKTTMIRLSLYDYRDGYILVIGTITVPNTAAEDAAVNNTNNKISI